MLLLAEVHVAATKALELPNESNTGWWIGLIAFFAIVVAVVVLVAAILTYAARIGDQARTGIQAMDQARENTLPIWDLQQLNGSATRIWRAAEAVREVLVRR